MPTNNYSAVLHGLTRSAPATTCGVIAMIGGYNCTHGNGDGDAAEASYLFQPDGPDLGMGDMAEGVRRLVIDRDDQRGEPEARALVRSRMPLTEYRITSQDSTVSAKGASTPGTSAGRCRF